MTSAYLPNKTDIHKLTLQLHFEYIITLFIVLAIVHSSLSVLYAVPLMLFEWMAKCQTLADTLVLVLIQRLCIDLEFLIHKMGLVHLHVLDVLMGPQREMLGQQDNIFGFYQNAPTDRYRIQM